MRNLLQLIDFPTRSYLIFNIAETILLHNLIIFWGWSTQECSWPFCLDNCKCTNPPLAPPCPNQWWYPLPFQM